MMKRFQTLLLATALLAALGCGGGASGNAPAPATLSGGPHTLSFTLAASGPLPVGGVSFSVVLPPGMAVATLDGGSQVDPAALAAGGAVTGPRVLQGTYNAASRRLQLVFATATDAAWSGEFLRLGVTVAAGSGITAAQVQALAAGFQGYKAVGVDTGSHSTVALAPQAVAAVAVVP